MDWLRDISEKRNEQQQEAQREQEELGSRLRSEADRVAPLVEELLQDIGRMWFGTSWKPWSPKFKVERQSADGWVLVASEDPCKPRRYLNVWLYMKSTHHATPHFKVANDVFSKDTSETELKRVLRIAAERGPQTYNAD